MAMDFSAAYKTLVTSPHLLALCARETTLSGLLEKIRDCFGEPALTDEQTLEVLAHCNGAMLESVPNLFDAGWMPYRYHAKTKTLSWCIPQGHPEESFHEQYIDRCRQQCLFNQIVSPQTLLAGLSGDYATHPPQPAGFIFHLSRCGSTLISGCLSEMNSTSVLSESPVLTGVLLDTFLSVSEKKKILRNLINHQARLYAGRRQVIIKWNAWDIFLWPLIHSIYPQVPAVFLVRNPIEVLASHQRMAGRHMSGDTSMSCLGGVFLGMRESEAPLDFRIRVLSELMSKMLAVAGEKNVTVMDYAELVEEKIINIARLFGLSLTSVERARLCQRMGFNSKAAGQIFKADGEQKHRLFDVGDTEKIHARLSPLYRQLLARTTNIEPEFDNA